MRFPERRLGLEGGMSAHARAGGSGAGKHPDSSPSGAGACPGIAHSLEASVSSLLDFLLQSLSHAACLSVCDFLFSCLSMYLSPSDSLCDTPMHTQMHNTRIYPLGTHTNHAHMYFPFFTYRH